MFDPETRQAIAKIAKRLDVPPAALLAVAEVESAGRTSAPVRGKREPLIRFEGHYFDRFLRGEKRNKARKLGLAHPRAGRVKNPRAQSRRWDLLDRAISIDRIAALSSCSWGLGQVMGSHWQWLGYGSADALVAEARNGVAGQVELMARFIEKSGLSNALRKRDWAHFARRYNGPAYRKNRYDVKMAEAYDRYRKLPPIPVLPDPVLETGDGTLKFGSRGPAVKTLQKALTVKGYPLVTDGLFGLKTDRALRRFQTDNGLEETGAVGESERKVLLEGKHLSSLKPSFWRQFILNCWKSLLDSMGFINGPRGLRNDNRP